VFSASLHSLRHLRTVSTVRPVDLATVSRIRAELGNGSARAARRAAMIGTGEIAEAAGVSRQSVAAWESGRAVPSAPHALAYARALAAVVPAA
jgi:DNA-binding XRE family transcriptional regulator